MRNQAQILLKRSCTLGKLVNTQIKGITLICTGKNTICISCVFNGFKYSCKSALYQNNIYKPHPSLVLVQPRKTLPYISESLLIGRKESNQAKSGSI